MTDPRRILAMGGGGFSMAERSPAHDRLVLELTGKANPRICFLPTASGDAREQVMRFHERFGAWICVPTTLSLFNLGRDRVADPGERLLAQDAIYVGGGSLRNMLAVWREHGIDEIMHAAWQAGIVLAGLSAGAMCWFDGGISMSGGLPQAVRGLGLIPGSLSVHMGGEPERMPAFRRAVESGALPGGWALDDGAALVLEGERVLDVVASHPGARAVHLSVTDGVLSEEVASPRLLPDASLSATEAPVTGDNLAIQELRELRALRQRGI